MSSPVIAGTSKPYAVGDWSVLYKASSAGFVEHNWRAPICSTRRTISSWCHSFAGQC